MHPDLTVDWAIPPTSPGLSGRVERFMGPGKSGSETLVETLGGALCFCCIVALAAADESVRGWSSLQIGLVVVLALDLVGGALTNATNSAKRWYHRPGRGRRRGRLLFLVVHLLHLAVVAFVLLPSDLTWWWTHLSLLAVAAVAVEWVPVEVKRPVAVASLICAVAVGQVIAPLDGVLALFPVLFYVKLVLGHLVPEAPLVARHAPATRADAEQAT
jgi:hypothetical protein